MWTVKYENDILGGDASEEGCFVEWWEVTNGFVIFKTETKLDAKWLCDVLNSLPKYLLLDDRPTFTNAVADDGVAPKNRGVFWKP